MAIMILPVHRRLAELHLIIKKRQLTVLEAADLMHCMQVNAKLVQEIDGFKEAAYAAQCNDQMDLVQHFSQKLDEMEAQCT